MLIIVVAIVVVLGVFIGAFVAGAIALEKHEYGDRTETLSSTLPQPQRALVVYQPSVTPASYDVAHAIARGLNDSGFEVKISNPGKHLSTDVSPYSVIVFGSPNYGGSVATPLRDYVEQIHSFSGKRVILFSTSAGVDTMPELEKLSELLNNVQEYSAFKFQFRETEKNKAVAYQLGQDTAAK